MKRELCPACGAGMYYSPSQAGDELQAVYQECHNAYCEFAPRPRSLLKRIIDLLEGEQYTFTSKLYRYSKEPGLRIKTDGN